MSTDAGIHGETRRVLERPDPELPALVHEDWRGAFPWLVQGTTSRGSEAEPFDLGLFGAASPPHAVHGRWNRLLAATGMRSAAHARQVHEADVRLHRDLSPGLVLVEPCDGHVTGESGVLLAVTVADCVPVFVVAPDVRAAGVLHAGWRGTAGGVLEAGLAVFSERLGADRGRLHVHLGPAICGECYEVGPEVFEAVGREAPDVATPIDLRAVLAERVVAAGVPGFQVTVSGHCTRCTASGLFSHRGGDPERQVGYVGIRA